MALILKDRVRESSVTAGTGTITLDGAVAGFQSFSVIGNTNTTYYAIVDVDTGAFEVGLGTYSTTGPTLTRDSVLESSTDGNLVNFTSNIKDVFCTYPAEQAVTLNDFQTLTNKTINLTSNTLVATSAQLRTAVTDETGTGSLVFNTSPTLVTPALGTPSSGAVTNLTGTASININGTVGATTPNTGNFTVLTENASPAVVQTDIGTAPNEVPLNQYLGDLAYQDAANIAGDVGVGGGLTVSRVGVTAPAASDGNVFSGTYTPTLTNTTNVSASTAFSCQYMRVGNVVTVSGAANINPTTAAGTFTEIRISLPINSTLPAFANCSGTGTAVFSVVAQSSFAIIQGGVANAARYLFNANSAANQSHLFQFTYRVI